MHSLNHSCCFTAQFFCYSECVHTQLASVTNYKHVAPHLPPHLHTHPHTKKKTELESTVGLAAERRLRLGALFTKDSTSTFAGSGPLSRSRKQKPPPPDMRYVCSPFICLLVPSGGANNGIFWFQIRGGTLSQMIYPHFPQFVCIHQSGGFFFVCVCVFF